MTDQGGTDSRNGQVVFTGTDGDDVNLGFAGVESLLEKGKTVPNKQALCRRRKTPLEKILFILTLVSTVVCVILIITLSIKLPKPQSTENAKSSISSLYNTANESICISSECVHAASRLLDFANFEVDPCVDFFEYACGTWNRRHVIPPDSAWYTTFSSHKDVVNVKLKDLLENPQKEDKIEAIQKAKTYYKACITEKFIDETGIQPLRNVIKDFGGWPVVEGDRWKDEGFDIVDMTVDLALRKTSVFIHLFVNADDKASHKNIIQLDQTRLGLVSRKHYLMERDSEVLKVYETSAVRAAMALGAEKRRAEREMAEIIDFEVKLAKITTPKEQRLNSSAMYNKMSVAELETAFPNFQWRKYIKTLFNKVGLVVNDTEPVVSFATEYFQKMIELLPTVSKRVIANYGIWRLVLANEDYLPKSYREIGKDFRRVLMGTTSDADRWELCVAQVTTRLSSAVARLFVTKHFDEKNRQNAIAMIGQIRAALYELIEEAPWMDTQTKIVAKAKAEMIQEKIGYPPYILNDTALNKEYETLKLDTREYFMNNMKCLMREAKSSLSHLHKPVSKTLWLKPPTVINAYYQSSSNQIVLPAGILQPPFYSEGYPKSVNFGGIGMVIGHEMTHGFDDKGRQYDKDGNMVQWWPHDVIEKFTAKAQCMVDQYSGFTIKSINMSLNGILTRGENIADNGGLKEAFRAYRNWVRDNNGGKEEPRLPGLLDFSHNQLFFLNFAQVWCGIMRDVAARDYVRTKIHCPGQFRVWGTLQNSYDFAEAYKCNINSPMNPQKKCAVW